jgi:hypothetical protein
MDWKTIGDFIGKLVIGVVALILLVQVGRALMGDINPVPPGLDSWTKWAAAAIAIGVAIRGSAKGFKSLL